jgi:hypothetical protein
MVDVSDHLWSQLSGLALGQAEGIPVRFYR